MAHTSCCKIFRALRTYAYRSCDCEKVWPIQQNTRGVNCQEAAKQATAFLGNRLSAVSMNNIWLHLKSCSACRTYVEQLSLARDSLCKLPGASISTRRRKNLLQRLARMAGDSGNT